MPRSTRNKIRWQVEKAAGDVDRMLAHLKYAEDLAGGLHPDLLTNLPGLVILALEFQKLLLEFRDTL